MNDAGSRRTRQRALALLLLVVGLVTPACTSSHDEDHDPRPTRNAVLDTIAASTVGDRLTVTAGVAQMPDKRSFIVRDVDLPDAGLLVLGVHPAGLRPNDLVTAEGTIALFRFEHFRSPYQLSDAAAYASFEGRKCLVSENVRSWA
jgi:hypothetical protein